MFKQEIETFKFKNNPFPPLLTHASCPATFNCLMSYTAINLNFEVREISRMFPATAFIICNVLVLDYENIRRQMKRENRNDAEFLLNFCIKS